MVTTRTSLDTRRVSTDRRRGPIDFSQGVDKTHRGSIDKGARGTEHSRELREQRRALALDAVLERPPDAAGDGMIMVETQKSRRRKSISLQRANSRAISGGSAGKLPGQSPTNGRWHRWVLDKTSQALGLPASASENIVNGGMDSREASQSTSAGPATRRRAAMDLQLSVGDGMGRNSLSDEDLKSDGSRRPSHEWQFRRRRGVDMPRTRSIRMSGEEDENHFLPPELVLRSTIFSMPDNVP